jgi:neurotransmitter:Na+ symporter, NSS family
LNRSGVPRRSVGGLGGKDGQATSTVFDCLGQLTSNLLLPLSGFGLAVLGGWVIQATVLADELGLSDPERRVLRVVLRYVAPLGIAAATVAPFVL